MLPGYGDSYTVWCSPDPGVIEWPFVFKDGYIDRAYVRMRYQDENGTWWPVNLNTRTNFKDDFTLKVAVPPCKMIDIYRDTPKDHVLVDYGQGGMLLGSPVRRTAIRQAMHVVVELKDLAPRTDLKCLCRCVES